MSLADELKKLENLRWNGTLTEEEFAQAKAALLAKLEQPSEGAAKDAVAEKLGEQLAELRYQNELERIDREWEAEKEQYMVTDKHGAKHVPTVGSSVGGAVVIGVFGLLWTAMAFSIAREMPNESALAIVRVVLPLLGIALIVLGVYTGVQGAQQAEAYNKALAAYQARRAAVKRTDSH